MLFLFVLQFHGWTYIDKLKSKNRTTWVFKEHLVIFSLTFFAHALKVKLQPNINFKDR